MSQRSELAYRTPGGTTELTSAQHARESRRVVFATTVGTTVEFYDFLLFGVCAVLVFGPQFFPAADPVASQFAALATFGVAFVARPLGALIAGHFGDRIGRKRMLILSFVLMGVSTALIGALPTYAQVGVLAPTLLVILRVVQGLSAGAEWGGALLMAVEHAPPHRRVLYGMTPVLGTILGGQLANLVVLVSSATTREAFAAWGWRLAFLVSFVLVIIGVFARTRLTESPLFEQAVRKEPPRVPLGALLRNNPAALARGIVVILATAMLGYIGHVFVLSYVTSQLGLSLNFVLTVWVAITPVMIGAGVGAAFAGDRFGTSKPLLVVGSFQVLAVITFYPLLESGSKILMVVAMIAYWVTYQAVFSLLAAVLAQLFPVHVRYTGVGLAYNIAFLFGGFGPAIATTLVAATGSTLMIGVALTCLVVASITVAVTGAARSASPPRNGSSA